MSSALQQRLGKTGILACMNGMACMGVAQKLKDEGKVVCCDCYLFWFLAPASELLSFPGSNKPINLPLPSITDHLPGQY